MKCTRRVFARVCVRVVDSGFDLQDVASTFVGSILLCGIPGLVDSVVLHFYFWLFLYLGFDTKTTIFENHLVQSIFAYWFG